MFHVKQNERINRLKAIVAAMPEKPGSYQFYDDTGTVIYVGKAKNLKRRVSSYLLKQVDRRKTEILVAKIQNITYTVVNTEEDALLLENALIKQYQPHYNILLKDSKTYPSICITTEPFPRVFPTRHIDRRGGTYYGPYSHVPTMRALLDVVRRLCRPRSCRQKMTEQTVAARTTRPCLDYHIGRCAAPCAAHITAKEYQRSIDMARELLRGNTREVLERLRTEMQELAEALRFEEAEQRKREYLIIKDYAAHSEVVSHTITDVDVFTMADDDVAGLSYVNYMHVAGGTINRSRTYEYRVSTDESAQERLLSAIVEIRQREGSSAREIVVEQELEWEIEGAAFFVPQRGDKRRLLDLSRQNCRQYRADRVKQSVAADPSARGTRLVAELQRLLGLPEPPRHIELYDNSSISGTNAVSACVVYRDMRPSKKEYRHYLLTTGGDDYASMRQVLRRRFAPLTPNIEDNVDNIDNVDNVDNRDNGNNIDNAGASKTCALPDLIIADGGAGQMSAMRSVLHGELGLHVPIAGLAKDGRHRTAELLFGDPVEHAQLRTDSELFRALTGMQDEVHRFAITFHRKRRSAAALHSVLDDIKGVGPATKQTLLREYKDIQGIRSVSRETPEQILSLVGRARGEIVVKFFNDIDL